MIKLKKNTISETETFSYEDEQLAILESIDNNMYLSIDIENICQISCDKLLAFMSLIHRKMRHGCLISISGIETKLLFEQFIIDNMNIEDLNHILSENKFLTTSREIRNILHQLNIKIESISINGIKFIIKGRRV